MDTHTNHHNLVLLIGEIIKFIFLLFKINSQTLQSVEINYDTYSHIDNLHSIGNF